MVVVVAYERLVLCVQNYVDTVDTRLVKFVSYFLTTLYYY